MISAENQGCEVAALAAEAERLIASMAASEGEVHKRFWELLQEIEVQARTLTPRSQEGAFYLALLALTDVDHLAQFETVSDEGLALLTAARAALAGLTRGLVGEEGRLVGYYCPRGVISPL